MSERKHFKFYLPATGRYARLEIDGEPITDACAVDIHSVVGEATTVTVTYINVDVDVEGVGEVA